MLPKFLYPPANISKTHHNFLISHLIQKGHFLSKFCIFLSLQHARRSSSFYCEYINQMKANFKKSEGNKLIAIVGDEDTVTGFLLTGIGERNVRGETNYLIIDEKSTKQSVETVFNRFLRDANISVILITQEASDKFLREIISQREEIYPVILEIPSKEKPYDPVKDVVMQRAHRLLYGSELSENS